MPDGLHGGEARRLPAGGRLSAAGKPRERVPQRAPTGGEPRLGELADELHHRSRQLAAARRLHRAPHLDRLLGLEALAGHRWLGGLGRNAGFGGRPGLVRVLAWALPGLARPGLAALCRAAARRGLGRWRAGAGRLDGTLGSSSRRPTDASAGAADCCARGRTRRAPAGDCWAPRRATARRTAEDCDAPAGGDVCAGSPAPAGSFLFARGAHRSAQSSRIGRRAYGMGARRR